MNTEKYRSQSTTRRTSRLQRFASILSVSCALFVSAQALAQAPFIQVSNNTYAAYSTDLTNGAWVYVDADSAGATPVRAMQRSLGYREVDYKSAVYPTLYFNQVAPVTNGATVTYDYTLQGSKGTNLVGFWAAKDTPVIIGPDGNPYITDGHHTTAGYLAPLSPVRQFVPGKNRVILGHVLANYYDPVAGPQPVTDAWWTARAAENQALLYSPDGDQLTQPGEPNYASLGPILPSVQAMPLSPSNITTNGATAMALSHNRSLGWGLADAVVVSATTSSGAKIAGFKKTFPGNPNDIFFVEFFWADFLRRRVVWDDTLPGVPLGSAANNTNLIAAPLSFFTAVANGIALARSEVYRDEYNRRIFDYTNAAVFTPVTVNWARGSLSNGLATATDTYNLYLRDDSTIVGAIQPSALSTNILHIDTMLPTGMTVTQTMQNIRTLIVNAGGRLNTSWKDANPTTVLNSTLILPAGLGLVMVTGTNFVAANTILGGGTLAVEGTLRSSLQVTNGVVQGNGSVTGALTTSGNGTLAPGASLGTLTVSGAVTLGGIALMEATKTAATITSDRLNGTSTLTYGGMLTLTVSGDALVAGDAFKLFDAASYSSAFASFNLPALDAGLSWDTSRLIVDGTISVVTGTTAPGFAAQPLSQIKNVGTTTTLIGGAVGTLPLTYQWQFNGNDLAGKTSPTLVLANIQESNQGAYRFTAQNAAGSVTSAPAILTVNQTPIVVGDSLATKKNLAVSVSAASLLANDSDPDGDMLSIMAVSASTNGAAVTLTNGVVTYTPKLNFLGRDQFTNTVSDGNATALGIVVVTVTSTNLPAPNQVTIVLTPTGRTIRFAGTPALRYAVQKAGDVTGPWLNLSPSITALPDGFVEFEDAELPAPAKRFYRAIAVP